MFPRDQLVDEAIKTAEKIAGLSSIIVAMAKEAVSACKCHTDCAFLSDSQQSVCHQNGGILYRMSLCICEIALGRKLLIMSQSLPLS